MLYCLALTAKERTNTKIAVFRCQSEEIFILILMKPKYPVHIIMFGVVISDGDVMSPFIFPLSHRSNTEANIKSLEWVELLWIGRVAAECSYVCQYDSALGLASRRTYLGCQKISTNRFLPRLQSPWLLCVGGVDWETNTTLCNTRDELKARITAAFTNLHKETSERFSGDFEVVWRLRLKPWMISLNKFNL